MSDAELDRHQIDTIKRHAANDTETCNDEEYMNSVKKFLEKPVSDESDTESDPNFLPKKYVSVQGTNIPRRSSRMSTSLYKDYSHVTSFEALPSIKLTLNLRNLPKCKQKDLPIVKKSKKHKKLKENEEEAIATTEELKQILEEANESANEMAHEKRDTRDETEITRLTAVNNKSSSLLKKKSTKTDERHKRKVLPKKKRVQTEASKKFHKLKNACRRKYGVGLKDLSINKTASTADKICKIDEPIQTEAAPIIFNFVGKETTKLVSPLHIVNDQVKSVANRSILVKTNSAKEVAIENNENDHQHNLIVKEKSEVETSNICTVITSTKNTVGKHKLPISIPARRTSIAEPLRVITKISNRETKVITPTENSIIKQVDLLPKQETNMIYIKSPEVLNKQFLPPTHTVPDNNSNDVQVKAEVSSPTSTSSLQKSVENNHVYMIEDISNESAPATDTPTDTPTIQNNTLVSRKPSTAESLKKIVLESNILSCPGYTSNPRRNSISTTDLFSSPSMALKRAISTGILQKVSQSTSITSVKLTQKNSSITSKEKIQKTSLARKKSEEDGPAPKRLKNNPKVADSNHTVLLSTSPHFPINYSSASASPRNSPNNNSLQSAVAPTTTISQQFYPPTHDLYSLARMHYERLARYTAISNAPKSQQHKTLSTVQNVRNVIIHQPCQMTNIDTPLNENLSSVYTTQCYPLNKSQTTALPSYLHDKLTNNTAGEKIQNNNNSAIKQKGNVNIRKPNYHTDSQSRPTSPLTISDSSSGDDSDIELEVDVVGNDSVEDQTTMRSKLMGTQKSGTSTNRFPSPSYSSSINFIEEIRKLQSVVQLLLERVGSHCSDKELQQIRQVILRPSAAVSGLKTNSTVGVINNNRSRLNSPKINSQDKSHMNSNKPLFSSLSQRTRSVISERPMLSTVQHAINDVIQESLKQQEKPIIHTNTSLSSVQALINNPKNYSTTGYVHQNGYQPPPLNVLTEQTIGHHIPNTYNGHSNDKQSRVPRSEQNLDHTVFFKEFTKMMYNKDVTNGEKHSRFFVDPTQSNSLQYRVIKPKSTVQPSTVIHAPERIPVKPPVSERPAVIYTANTNPPNLKTNHVDFHYPPRPSHINMYEHMYLGKDAPNRSRSTDDSIARSPDSGYISPSTKVSPHLPNSEPAYITKRRHSSFYESADRTKTLPHHMVANVMDQTSEQIIQRLLPKLYHCGTLTPEQYVKEMYTLEMEQCPPFLLQFYSYVTKKQISSNQSPISFKIFLEFKSAGKLKMFENSFVVYTNKQEQERYLKRC